MDTVRRVGRAVQQGWQATRRTWSDPQQRHVANQDASVRAPFYDLMWDYLTNAIWQDVEYYREDRRINKRYGNIRSIYNPFWRVVRFYMTEVYPPSVRSSIKRTRRMMGGAGGNRMAALAAAGRNDRGLVPFSEQTAQATDPLDNIASAIPLQDDIDVALKRAIVQWQQWTNFPTLKNVFLIRTAALGNVLVELVDDLVREKVTADVHWPGNIKQLELDNTGNVKMYWLEWLVPLLDAKGVRTGESYRYGKRVDSRTVTTFKDNEEWDYTATPENAAKGVKPRGSKWDHGYGFCPAVWYKFIDLGEDFGQPAMFGTLDKLDQLNGLASMFHDQLAKIMKSPVVITTPGATVATLTQAETREKERRDKAGTGREQEDIKVVSFPTGSDVKALPLDVGQTLNAIIHLLGEIASDHPETHVYEMMRERNISGVAAREMLGDVSGLLYDFEDRCDLQTIKLHQMALAISGENIKQGRWGKYKPGGLTAQQKAFQAFNLDSYDAGDLNFAILARPIFEQTDKERWETEEVKMRALVAKLSLAIPTSQLRAETDDYTDEQLDEMDALEEGNSQQLGADLLSLGFNAGAGFTPGANNGQNQQQQGQALTNGNPLAPGGGQNQAATVGNNGAAATRGQ